MMLMIPAGYEKATADTRPDFKAMNEMGKYNETLQKAGVLLALDGLHPPPAGVRLKFSAGKPTITDGPFAEAKEMIGGFWILQVKSKEEAVEWASRCPANDGDTIEVRQVFEMSDFSPEVWEAAVKEDVPWLDKEEKDAISEHLQNG
jgi:hypothetical protein